MNKLEILLKKNEIIEELYLHWNNLSKYSL